MDPLLVESFIYRRCARDQTDAIRDELTQLVQQIDVIRARPITDFTDVIRLGRAQPYRPAIFAAFILRM